MAATPAPKVTSGTTQVTVSNGSYATCNGFSRFQLQLQRQRQHQGVQDPALDPSLG